MPTVPAWKWCYVCRWHHEKNITFKQVVLLAAIPCIAGLDALDEAINGERPKFRFIEPSDAFNRQVKTTMKYNLKCLMECLMDCHIFRKFVTFTAPQEDFNFIKTGLQNQTPI